MKNNKLIKIFFVIYMVVIIAGIVVYFVVKSPKDSTTASSDNVNETSVYAEKETELTTKATTKATEATSAKATETAKATEATKPTEATTAAPKPTEAPTTAPKPTEAPTEAPSETQTSEPSYVFANGVKNPAGTYTYTVTGADYINMHNEKTGNSAFGMIPGGSTGNVISVEAYYSLIDYNGVRGYVYNHYLTLN